MVFVHDVAELCQNKLVVVVTCDTVFGCCISCFDVPYEAEDTLILNFILSNSNGLGL